MPSLKDTCGQPIETVKQWQDMVDQVRSLRPKKRAPATVQRVIVEQFGNQYRVTCRPSIQLDMNPRVDVRRLLRCRWCWVLQTGRRRRQIIKALAQGIPYVEA